MLITWYQKEFVVHVYTLDFVFTLGKVGVTCMYAFIVKWMCVHSFNLQSEA